MSLAHLPPALRAPMAFSAAARTSLLRSFHTSSVSRASILFALSSLSNSRETQHFNKLSRLSRVEHSPPLKLIKTSEVDPFPLPTPPKPAPPSIAWSHDSARNVARVWDDKALAIGRTVLADQAKQALRLQRMLERARRRRAKQELLSKRERRGWQEERRKMRNEMRVAGAWILASIGTATVLATWRFWPQTEYGPDSADLGRKLAARAAASMPLPPAISAQPAVVTPVATPVTSAEPAMEKELISAQAQPTVTLSEAPKSWLRGLFWKQQ